LAVDRIVVCTTNESPTQEIGSMRLLTIAFPTATDYLAHYRADGALHVRTRTPLLPAETLLMEIAFPGLPSRAVARGVVGTVEAGCGAWIRFHEADASTRDFLVGVARGKIAVARKNSRCHDRFPTSLSVDYRITDAAEQRQASRLDDLGAGGAFIQSVPGVTPPPVGTRVSLRLHPAPHAGVGALTLHAKVTWIRSGPAGGFGVRFDDRSRLDHRLLRRLLRKASETGKVKFAAG
jgi:hypothetical protein